MAYDVILRQNPGSASKRYLKILYLAAHETETGVENALSDLLENEQKVTEDSVKSILQENAPVFKCPAMQIDKIDLGIYDCFLNAEGVSS